MINVTSTVFILVVVATSSEGKSVKFKRSLEDMARMVRLKTGQSALDFNDYGNYCGFGGEGVPVDGIDRCCADHDQCYSFLIGNQCFSYFIPYKYEVQGYNIECVATGDWCRDITCSCDKILAECIAQFPYNPRFKHFTVLGQFLQRILRY